MNILREYTLGDMLLTYLLDDEQHVGMRLIPVSTKDRVLEKDVKLEPLVQLHARGDQMPAGYGNGHTMATTPASEAMKFVSQEQDGDTIITTVSDGAGRVARHDLTWCEGNRAVRVSVSFENQSERDITLDLLASLNVGMLTPFTPGDAVNALRLHRARSNWAVEGLLETMTIEELSLETAWSTHAMRVEKFGQLGSMPVRGYFPFAAV
ncbi:MAG: alpha-galactosidase, partial [Ruminococcaceae bacterium]|nr:alpha-galactosidase [Oscillospiraceae bacterium]